MKPGDLVRRKGMGWLAVILSISGDAVEFIHMSDHAWMGNIDNCWPGLFEVISESR